MSENVLTMPASVRHFLTLAKAELKRAIVACNDEVRP